MRAAANELRRKGVALARFAALLDSSRKALARSYAALARAIDSPRERSQSRASANTVSNWCKGKALPTEIEPLLRALFGQDRTSGTEPRETLRQAYQAAVAERHGTAVAGAAANPGAGRWVIDSEPKFVPDPAAAPEDRQAAADPLRAQMQQALRRMAARLVAACGPEGRDKRFGNSEYFTELPTAAAEFQAEIDREPGELAGRLGVIYPLLQQLARYRETDDDVRQQDRDAALDPATRGALLDLVHTGAPWARGFPSVVLWDDEAGRMLAAAARPRSPETVVVAAHTRNIIGAVDAGRLARLVALANEHAPGRAPMGRKLGNRATAEADNLVLALAELAAAALAGAVSPGNAELSRRSGATLADAADYVVALADTRPPDLREALLALAAAGRGLERDGPATLTPRLPEPVPEDVEAQALAMILTGKAPPESWVPHIRRLEFPRGTFSRPDLLAGLTGLQFLYLSNTGVSDAAPLAGLTGLRTLYLSDTKVRDVSMLAHLTDLQIIGSPRKRPARAAAPRRGRRR
ncbi:MAG TPA: leucine-rich repeat domain-containing protein [Stellaceae bacterium]|nr:leucine-rich repeat domain-containing protein [Stellaceae bacterium]